MLDKSNLWWINCIWSRKQLHAFQPKLRIPTEKSTKTPNKRIASPVKFIQWDSLWCGFSCKKKDFSINPVSAAHTAMNNSALPPATCHGSTLPLVWSAALGNMNVTNPTSHCNNARTRNTSHYECFDGNIITLGIVLRFFCAFENKIKKKCCYFILGPSPNNYHNDKIIMLRITKK